MAENKAHVSEGKKKVVKEFVDLINEYPIVAAVNLENMPAPQLQKMRAILRESVVMRMTKRRLINIAIDQCLESKKGIEQLKEHLPGMPALLFTKENPFKLCKTIGENKSKAPAKGGQTAPNDITVSAGVTPFAPGPIIGELGSLGLKTGVEDGKVAIQEDKIVVKEGEEISQKAAELLTRLGIEPMEIGLDLVAAFENGTIFTKKVLTIDEEAFNNDVSSALRNSFLLGLHIGYPTKETIVPLITNAFRDARGLALEQNILADGLVEDVISKVERQALALKEAGNIEVGAKKEADPVEEKKEESKAEEKPVEATPEPEAPKVEEKPKEEAKPVEESKAEEKTVEPPKEEEPKDTSEQKKNLKTPEISEIETKKEGNVETVGESEEVVVKKFKEDAQKLKEQVEKDKEEIKEIIKNAPEVDKEEIKKEAEEIQKLAENAIKREEKLEKVEEKYQEAIKEQDATELIKEVKQKQEVSEKDKKEVEQAEQLYEQLKKKGTLRDVDKKEEEPKLEVKGKFPTAEELIAFQRKKQLLKKGGVPTAHDLLSRKK
jgi:large subunit ribosomal protein L10